MDKELPSKEITSVPATGREQAAEDNDLLVKGLKAAVGPGGALETAVNQFLSGEGTLLETVRSASTRRGGSPVSEVAAWLSDKFDLNRTAAKLIATLLVKLFPSITQLTGKTAASKKKRRRKTTTSARSTSKRKGTKKKTATSKPAARKKPTANTRKKKTAPRRKKTSRSVSAED